MLKLLPLCRHRSLPTFCATWASCRVRQAKPVALFLLMLWSLTLTGCAFGPTVEVRHVLIHPGQPLRVMENKKLVGERLDGGGMATHDVGGWVMMPPDHWEVIANLIKQSQAAAQPQPKQPPQSLQPVKP